MKILVLILTILSLIACVEEESKQTPAKQVTAGQKKERFLSGQEKMVQKAKNTEKLIKEADEKRRKALEDQSN